MKLKNGQRTQTKIAAEKFEGHIFNGIKIDEYNKDRAGRCKIYYSIFCPEAGDLWPVRVEIDRGETINPALLNWFDISQPKFLIRFIDDHEKMEHLLLKALGIIREGKAQFAPNTTNAFIDDWIKDTEIFFRKLDRLEE